MVIRIFIFFDVTIGDTDGVVPASVAEPEPVGANINAWVGDCLVSP